MRSGTSLWIVLAATGTLLILVLLPPLVDAPTRAVVMAAFSGICHQLPERTLHVGALPLAVCSRCLGIYGGMFAGVAVYPWLGQWDGYARARAGYLLVLALAVPGVDWLAGVIHLWESGHVLRLATGAWFGLIAGYFLARAARAAGRSPGSRSGEDAQASTLARS